MRDFRHYISLFILSLLLLSGCTQSRIDEPSIVILLVESLGENDFVCSEIRTLDHLEELKSQCNKFTRFTHAFAPSTLSQAVISSLMTGEDVRDHGVVHNGAVAIGAEVDTLAEKAVRKGMKTGFFSGGAPIFNKFGIHQGFEVFDHSYSKKDKAHFRPVLQTMKAGLKWVDNNAKGYPVFMTLYLPDLLYLKKTTTTDEGNERAMDRQAQLNEIYESINEFITEFKKRKRWKKTFFIIAGVGGQTIFRGKAPYLLNDITSQRTHIALQVKPSKNLQGSFKKTYNDMLPLSDISHFLNDYIFSKDKPILFETWLGKRKNKIVNLHSDWGVWRAGQILPTEGFRMDQYLFTFSPQLRVYDSFVDAREIEPLPSAEALMVAKKYNIDRYMKSIKTDLCIQSTFKNQINSLPRKSTCGQMLSSTKDRSKGLARFLEDRWENIDSNDKFAALLWRDVDQFKDLEPMVVKGWLAHYFLGKNRWEDLLKLSAMEQNDFWKIIAQKNLDADVVIEGKDCRIYFYDVNKSLGDFYRHCGDSSLRKIAEGLSLLREGKKALRGFWQEIENIKKRRMVKMLNLELMLINDVKEVLNFEPTLSELYFFLPENNKFKDLIEINKP